MPLRSVNTLSGKAIAALICCAALAWAAPTRAADLVSVGSVDATSANLWPLHIAQKNGYFDAANLKIDLVFAQSNASVIQQLAAGSYAVAPSAGIARSWRSARRFHGRSSRPAGRDADFRLAHNGSP